MKINFVIPGVSLTGGIMVVFRYAEILQKRGHEVTLYVPLKALDVKNSRKEIVNKTHIITNTIKRIWLYGFKRIHNNVGYNVNIKTVSSINNRTISDADVVIATAWPTAFLVDKLNCEKGKKVYFIQGYEIWNNEEYGKKTYELGLNKIVISKWIDNKLKIQLGCQDNPIVYDGIDDIFLNKPYRGRKFDDNIKITMLYNSLPKKGVKCGLDAYNLLKKKYPKVELTLFGLEKNPNISGEINYIYAPSRHQLSELYSESVVFLFPSLEEGWGLTPLEAMTAGCVVVGTNTGCMIDLGKNKENVLISEPGDVQGMVNNLTYVIENPEEAKTISFNGYNTVQQLNWENSSNEFEKQLLKIVGGNDEN